MVNVHTGMPRLQPDRYIKIEKKPHPSQSGWWTVTISVHGENEIVIDLALTEAEMTPGGAKSRAIELARSKDIRDVIILDAK